MTREQLEECRQQWLKWLALCIEYVTGELKDHRTMEIPHVKALLVAKQENVWDLDFAKESFEYWYGTKGRDFKWNNAEWYLMQGLYQYSIGPLPFENYYEGELNNIVPSEVFRRDFSFTHDLITLVRGVVDHLGTGLSVIQDEGEGLAKVQDHMEAMMPSTPSPEPRPKKKSKKS